jgi:hypothetical protein
LFQISVVLCQNLMGKVGVSPSDISSSTPSTLTATPSPGMAASSLSYASFQPVQSQTPENNFYLRGNSNEDSSLPLASNISPSTQEWQTNPSGINGEGGDGPSVYYSLPAATQIIHSITSMNNENTLEQNISPIADQQFTEVQQPVDGVSAEQHQTQNGPSAAEVASMMQISGLDHLIANVKDPFDKTKETPLYWKLLRTGNVSVLPYLTDCLNLVMASEAGVTLNEEIEEEGEAEADLWSDQPHDASTSTSLQVLTLPSERRYVNVDTTTQEGLNHAKGLHLIESGMAEVVVSPLLQEAAHTLFDDASAIMGRQARVFTILRNPVEKVVSMFYMLKSKSNKSGSHAWIKDMTLVEYVNSEFAESNRLVRSLVSKQSDALHRSDLELAKAILKEKVLVGLSSDLSQSLERIRLYFGWSDDAHVRFGVPQKPDQCKAIYLQEAHINHHHVDHPPVVVGSEEWEVLKKKNWADVALFEYASDVLYREQAAMFPTLSSSTESQPQNA